MTSRVAQGHRLDRHKRAGTSAAEIPCVIELLIAAYDEPTTHVAEAFAPLHYTESPVVGVNRVG